MDEEYDDEDYLIPEDERKDVLDKALNPALKLESSGDIVGAWKMLYDEWLAYTAHEIGVTTVVQPGGSMRDQESIDAADEHGMAMIFTGQRLFLH